MASSQKTALSCLNAQLINSRLVAAKSKLFCNSMLFARSGPGMLSLAEPIARIERPGLTPELV